MKVAVLSSGGKDSNAALWWAQCKGWEVSKLVTMLVTGEDSWMFQVPGTSLVEHQAKLCGIEWLPVETKGIVDEEEIGIRRLIPSDFKVLEQVGFLEVQLK